MMMNNNDDEIILSEDEVTKIREENSKNSHTKQIVMPVEPIEPDYTDLKLIATGDCVGVKYESGGRFSMPETAYWNDFKLSHVHTITMSRQEDILENLVVILNKTKHGHEVPVEQMLLEEFFETLIAIKQKYRGDNHIHRWVCDCQDDIDDKDKKASEQVIALSSIQYKNISEADNTYRDYVLKTLGNLPNEGKDYIKEYNRKYATDLTSISQLVERAIISEPFRIVGNKKLYEFNFSRVGDLIRAKRIAETEFSQKIKQVKSDRWGNRGSLAEWKNEQEYKLKNMQDDKSRAIILYSKALSLKSINGIELSESEKIQEFKDLDINVSEQLNNLLESSKFGIQDERDYTCNLCGKIERGSLQQRANIIEFIPLTSNSGGELPVNTSNGIYVVL